MKVKKVQSEKQVEHYERKPQTIPKMEKKSKTNQAKTVKKTLKNTEE